MQSVQDKGIHKYIHQVMNKHAIPNGIEAYGNIAKNGAKQGSHKYFGARLANVKKGSKQGLNKKYGKDFFGAGFVTQPAKLKKATEHTFIGEKVKKVGKLVKGKGHPRKSDEFGKRIFGLQHRFS